ncbi:MAG: hypothetical protein ACW99F_13455 [Candidatus Hodarchaeales archaeon]|jgi:hypothetical protein
MTEYDKRHPIVSARVSRIVKAAIDKLADNRSESRNEVIDRLLRDGLISRGILLVEEKLRDENDA